MQIIVAGGGTVGEQVTRALSAAGNTVTIVESDAMRASALARRGMNVVTGDACAAATLEAAGALRADVLVACTGGDEENLVIALLARRHLEVPRIVARVNDDVNQWLFNDSWGVDAAVSSASILVGLIEEATGSARTARLADLAAAGRVLLEVTIAKNSPACGKTAADLPLARRDLIAALIRHGKAMPAQETIHFSAGDRVLILTDPDGEPRVHHAFHTHTV